MRHVGGAHVNVVLSVDVIVVQLYVLSAGYYVVIVMNDTVGTHARNSVRDHDVEVVDGVQLVLQNVVYVELYNVRDVYVEPENTDISVMGVTDYKFFYLPSKQKNKKY